MITTTTKKVFKYEFISRVLGRIQASDPIFNDDYDEELTLDSINMATLYNNCYELEEWAEEEKDDLAQIFNRSYLVDYKLSSMRFGNLETIEGRLYHVTKVDVDRELKEHEIDELKVFINGQLSDGWGEGAEQHEFKEDRLEKTVPRWDDYSLEFDDAIQHVDVYYYCILSEYSVEDFRFVGTESQETQIAHVTGHLSLELEEGKVHNSDIYRFESFYNFVEFCKMNQDTHDLLGFVDCSDLRDLAPFGAIFLRSRDDDFSDSPIAYENKDGKITVQRLGGNDVYDTVLDMIYKLLGDAF